MTALPHVVAFNLTRRCDLACAHCYIDGGPRADTDELDTAEVCRIADEVLALSPGPLFVLTGGEPLLRDDLPDIARHMSGRGATVVVGTNGTGLTPGRLADLVAAGVQGVAISVDALDPAVHDAFRGRPGALERALAGVDCAREAGLPFLIQTTLTRHNQRDLEALAAWAASVGALAFNLYLLVRTGRAADHPGLEPHEADRALRQLVALRARYEGRLRVQAKCQPHAVRFAEPPYIGTQCPAGRWYVRITPQGRVTPCPYLPLEAGDLRRQSFASVWTGPVLTELRTRSPEGRCGACALRDACGGCRARPYAESGALFGADPSCTRVPDGIEEPIAVEPYGGDATPVLAWTEEAERALQRIPSFVRGRIVRRVEAWAREHGVARITREDLSRLRPKMHGLRHPG